MHFEHNIYQYKKKCVPNFEMFSGPFKLFDMVIWFVFSALFDRWPTMVCWWSLEPAAMNRGEGRWYIPNISALHNRCRSFHRWVLVLNIVIETIYLKKAFYWLLHNFDDLVLLYGLTHCHLKRNCIVKDFFTGMINAC